MIKFRYNGGPFDDFVSVEGKVWGKRPVLVSEEPLAEFSRYTYTYRDGSVDSTYLAPATPAAMLQYNIDMPETNWVAASATMRILSAYTAGYIIVDNDMAGLQIHKIDPEPYLSGEFPVTRLARPQWHSHYNRELAHTGDYTPYPFLAADECVAKDYCTGWEEMGNSGIASRRWVRLEGFCQIEVEAYRVRRDHMVRDDLFIVSWEPETITIPNPVAWAQCQDILSRHAKTEAHREVYSWFGDSDVVTVREYNKTLASDFGLPEDVFSVRGRGTSCGNTTMVLVRIPEGRNEIAVPDDMKGLIIGRGGRTINDLSRKVGRHLIVK